MNNKRIHELLEWVKSQKVTKRYILNEKEIEENKKLREEYASKGYAVYIMPVDPVYGESYEYMDPIHEILQHLLEVDIKRTEMQEEWAKTIDTGLREIGLEIVEKIEYGKPIKIK